MVRREPSWLAGLCCGLLLPLLLLPGLRVAAGEAPERVAAPNPVPLDAWDRAALATLACPTTGVRDEKDLRASRTPSRKVRVEVRCATAAPQPGLPIFQVMACDNVQPGWRCTPAGEGLRMTLPNEKTLTVMPRGISAALAAEAVNEAAKLTIRPFYRPAVNVMVDECTVGAAASGASSSGMSSVEIRCGEAVIFLTRDCWQQQPCRFFIPFAQNY